ncbi:MAG TPA: hypothetical protein VN028_05095, partial [Rhodocyclaceae bacterium]|nr:hypothetical protein [Rhodocyclaceae bacterium]
RSRHDAPEALARQLAFPIRWDWCQETLLSMGFEVALELGPGNDLARLLATGATTISASSPACRSVDEFASADSLQTWLQRQA